MDQCKNISRHYAAALATEAKKWILGSADSLLSMTFIKVNIPAFPSATWEPKKLMVTSSHGAAPADLEAALSLIANKTIDIKDTITQTLPLQKIQAAFNIVAEAKESLKVVLEP